MIIMVGSIVSISDLNVKILLNNPEEILIGDLTEFDVDKEDKISQGHKAISKVLGDLLSGKQIEKLILEFDAKDTGEAKFAYWCDKLECDLQAKIYDEEDRVDINNPFGEDKRDVLEWIKKANDHGIEVHIWMQIFNTGNWISPSSPCS